jgi:precorrin-6B C5,15-methyltransferase / cobalt-precorrin-6B C5,C15-methyltransferase
MSKIAIIGIGDDGLDALPPAVASRIVAADVLLGSERVLQLLPPQVKGERVVMDANPEQLSEQLRGAQNRAAAILVFGDPMFYGLARYICESLGKEQFEVIPHVSSMQLAFARVMESWDEAYLTNLANHPLATVVEKIRTAGSVGLFTTDSVPPARVAQELLDKRIDYFDVYVCENLGSRNERVTRGSLAEIAMQKFEPLNVMILVRDPHAPDRALEEFGARVFGNPDQAFLQSQPKYGLLTTSEVRSLALGQMDLRPDSIVWDVGAGSGSVSIEAAQLASAGRVYAIEMDPADQQLIRENASRFGVTNIDPVLGKAPEAWAGLPDPHSIFIAGAGREVRRIAEAAFQRLRPGGSLVVSLAMLDHLAELRNALRAESDAVDVWMINIARGTDQFDQLTFDSLKPSFLLAASK